LPFLFVLSVFAVKEAKAFLARSDWRGRLGLGLTFLAAATFSLLPHPFPSNRELNRSLYNEAHVMRLGGRHREAAQLLRLCIQQGVGGVDAWNELALCSVEMDRTSEAEWIWRYIARLEPEAFEAHYNLGVSLQEREGYAEALKSYASARALDPTMRPLLLRMAFCARKLGHVELANRFLAEAAAISLR